MRNTKAFTLVEILVAVGIMAAIGWQTRGISPLPGIYDLSLYFVKSPAAFLFFSVGIFACLESLRYIFTQRAA